MSDNSNRFLYRLETRAIRLSMHSQPPMKNSGPQITLMKPGIKDMVRSKDTKLNTSTHIRTSTGARRKVGQFRTPNDIALSESGYLAYVVDRGNCRIQYFFYDTTGVAPASLGRVKALFK